MRLSSVSHDIRRVSGCRIVLGERHIRKGISANCAGCPATRSNSCQGGGESPLSKRDPGRCDVSDREVRILRHGTVGQRDGFAQIILGDFAPAE